jgi:hypothetical protein
MTWVPKWLKVVKEPAHTLESVHGRGAVFVTEKSVRSNVNMELIVEVGIGHADQIRQHARGPEPTQDKHAGAMPVHLAVDIPIAELIRPSKLPLFHSRLCSVRIHPCSSYRLQPTDRPGPPSKSTTNIRQFTSLPRHQVASAVPPLPQPPAHTHSPAALPRPAPEPPSAHKRTRLPELS